GLSALLSDSLAQGDDLLEVDIDLIEPNPDQPRLGFDAKKLEELAQSIRSNGLVQPILLRRVSDGRYQIVAGERRWRAAQQAGLHRINAVVREIPDSKLLELALIENIQREELNPIEEAQAYQRLIRDFKLSQDDMAQRVGKDRSSIANYLRLLKLPAQIQKMLEDGSLSMGHARALLGLDSEQLQMKMANDIVSGKISVRETERAVKRASSGSRKRENSTALRNDANIRAAELKMKRFLGTQVKIQLGQTGGRIEIEFSSLSELDRIFSIIMRKSDT
ncbi:MAG: ParB/RepB/Spo0J family partition protein, partial [Acidobacteria bacterium]|nr:ParB/RepB/Spo0J family partition protein [Acidobacteriota bacterium]